MKGGRGRGERMGGKGGGGKGRKGGSQKNQCGRQQIISNIEKPSAVC